MLLVCYSSRYADCRPQSILYRTRWFLLPILADCRKFLTLHAYKIDYEELSAALTIQDVHQVSLDEAEEEISPLPPLVFDPLDKTVMEVNRLLRMQANMKDVSTVAEARYMTLKSVMDLVPEHARLTVKIYRIKPPNRYNALGQVEYKRK